jgi:FtsH-binding integral membrane protein
MGWTAGFGCFGEGAMGNGRGNAVTRYVVGHAELQRHMVSTYFCLRLGMTVLAASSPVIIMGWAVLWGANWEGSLSAYYFSPNDGKTWTYSMFPGRVPFVGILFALGFALWAYKGYTRRENLVLNLAGWSALGVAIFPMYAEDNYITFSETAHFASAACLFACMAVVALFFSKDSLTEITDADVRRRYRGLYRLLGGLMLAFPAIGWAIARLIGSPERQVLCIEVVGILIFATYWGLKTFELRSMEVDIKALKGDLPAQKEEQAALAAAPPPGPA